MSFYIRKSVKFGPLRFNISKSGIGVSAGIKGARLATGPRGTYVHLGRHGIYYRQHFNGSIVEVPPEDANSQQELGRELGHNRATDINNLVEVSNKESLLQINERIGQTNIASVIAVVATVSAYVIIQTILSIATALPEPLSAFVSTILVFFVVITGTAWIFFIWLAWVTYQQGKLAKTTTLKYDLDKQTWAEFNAFQESLRTLAESAYLWEIISQRSNIDWKRNAGVTDLLDRARIRVEHTYPPFLQIEKKVCGLSLGYMRLFFLPDQLFVFQNGRYGAVSYSSLQVSFTPLRFVEGESVPHDSEVIDTKWRYVRQDGGPDRRFSNNYEIPVVNYGLIEISSDTGLNVQLCGSNLDYAEQFAQAFREYKEYCQSLGTNPSQPNSLIEREPSLRGDGALQSRAHPNRQLPFEVSSTIERSGEPNMNNLLKKAIAAVESGDKKSGYKLLAEIIKADPRGKDAELAWLLMYAIVDDPKRKRQCLETVLDINPNNVTANQELSEMIAGEKSSTPIDRESLSKPGAYQAGIYTIATGPDAHEHTLTYYGPTMPDEYARRYHQYISQAQSAVKQIDYLAANYREGGSNPDATVAALYDGIEQLRQVLRQFDSDIDTIKLEYQQIAEQQPLSKRQQVFADRDAMLAPFNLFRAGLDEIMAKRGWSEM